MIEEQFVSFDTAKMLKEAGLKPNVVSLLMMMEENFIVPRRHWRRGGFARRMVL